MAGPRFTVSPALGAGLSALAAGLFPDGADAANAALAKYRNAQTDIMRATRGSALALGDMVAGGTASPNEILGQMALQDPQFVEKYRFLLPATMGLRGDVPGASNMASLTGVQGFENTPTGFAQADATRQYGYGAQAAATVQVARIAAAQRAAEAANRLAWAREQFLRSDPAAIPAGALLPGMDTERRSKLGVPAEGPIYGPATESTATGAAIEKYTSKGPKELADVVVPPQVTNAREGAAAAQQQWAAGDLKLGAGDVAYLSPERQAALGLVGPIYGPATESTATGALKQQYADKGPKELAELVAPPAVTNARETPVNVVRPDGTVVSMPADAAAGQGVLADQIALSTQGNRVIAGAPPGTGQNGRPPEFSPADLENFKSQLAQVMGVDEASLALVGDQLLMQALMVGSAETQRTNNAVLGLRAAADFIRAAGSLSDPGWFTGGWQPNKPTAPKVLAPPAAGPAGAPVLAPQPVAPAAAPAPAARSAPMAPPKPGDIVEGYRFRGGNPNDQRNWVPAA